MKNAPIIISVIALLGVILLFIQKVSNKETSSKTENAGGINNIAYVNIDSLVGAYDYYNDIKTSFYQNQNQKELELDSRYKALQRKAYDVNNQVRSNMMTPTKAQNLQQQLAIEEQKIMQDKQKYEMELAEESQRINFEILDSIKNYLEIYNKDKKYSLILANDTIGRAVMLADDEMNISKDVVTALNLRYQASKKVEKKDK
jgi:outer membrane protein